MSHLRQVYSWAASVMCRYCRSLLRSRSAFDLGSHRNGSRDCHTLRRCNPLVSAWLTRPGLAHNVRSSLPSILRTYGERKLTGPFTRAMRGYSTALALRGRIALPFDRHDRPSRMHRTPGIAGAIARRRPSIQTLLNADGILNILMTRAAKPRETAEVPGPNATNKWAATNL